MSHYNIMTILISHRSDSAKLVQETLTKYGCNIKVRLGLHETSQVCAEDGLIVLQLTGEHDEIKAMEKALNALDGVRTNLIMY